MAEILVIGDSHNAWVTAYCLAKIGHGVVLVRPDPEAQPPEEGLESLGVSAPTLVQEGYAQAPDGTLLLAAGAPWASPWTESIPESAYIWIAQDTPLTSSGDPNVWGSWLVSSLKECSDTGRKLIVSSQMPVGSLSGSAWGPWRACAYVPENMRRGRAIDGFLKPDRLVVGASSYEYGDEIMRLLAGIDAKWRVVTDLATAEMVKHATNAFLGTQISLSNELGRIGKHYGVDMVVVSRALGADSRIGPYAYTTSGRPFEGGTIKRDLRALQAAAAAYDEESRVVDAVLDVNRYMPPWRVESSELGALQDAGVAPAAACSHPGPMRSGDFFEWCPRCGSTRQWAAGNWSAWTAPDARTGPTDVSGAVAGEKP
jgi:UDPglucose 6-dehydrogenase